MKQYQYNKTVWRKTGDDTVFLRDARGLLGSDPKLIEIPEVVYENGKEMPVVGIWFGAFQSIGREVRRIFIPRTVREIINWSFFFFFGSTDSLDNLEEIVVDEANESYSGVGPGLYSKDLKRLVYFPEKNTKYDTIPEQTVLDDSFFWGRDSELMPERIRKFEPKREIAEEDMLHLHGFGCFADEYRNVNLLQHKGETHIACIDKIDGDWNDVVLPDSVRIFSSGAFMNARMKSVNLPKMIKKIETCAFFPLCGMETLEIPATMENIDPHGFDEAEKVKHLILPRGIKDCKFLFNFINLETIEMKDSSNGLTNFVLEDGVLYSADKSELVKYLTSKKDKEFQIPDEVTHVVDGAFRNNLYIEKIIVPHHNINTINVEWPLTKDDENLKDLYSRYEPCHSEDTYWDAHKDFQIREKCKQSLHHPLFGGCTALKALVYDDGAMVFGDDFDVVKEGVTTLMPVEMSATKGKEEYCYLLVDGALCWKDTEEDNLLLEHYPIEKKDEVLVVDKRIGHIASLENRFVKKLVIYNTYNENLFRSVVEWWLVAYPACVNLPSLEEIEVIGNDGCFFVKNGCLFHMEGDTVRFDISIPNKKRYGEYMDGKNIVSLETETLGGKHFYCPKYEIAVRKAYNGRYYARFKQQVYCVVMQDFFEEDTGNTITIPAADLFGFIMADEIELPSDSCILAECDKKEGMTPITEREYRTIDGDEVSKEGLGYAESKKCLQSAIKYFKANQEGCPLI